MDIRCGSCGSEDLIRDPDVSTMGAIPLLCQSCGWRGSRTPIPSCRRCGSTEVDATPIDGWAYADLDEYREKPESAEWGYVDKTVFRCRRCRAEWQIAGEYRPYTEGGSGDR